MKTYHKNPRQISERQLADLRRWLRELGDLSGIVHDLNSDEIISGNQRGRVFSLFDLQDCEIVLTQESDEPDDQGTVGLGYVVWQGKQYNYRQVRWDKRTAERANIVANRAGGDWDYDILANNWDVGDLLEWGFNEQDFELQGWDLSGDDDAPEDPGPQIDRADELQEKWQVQRGQVWEIGRHRLMCGDSTCAEDVGQLMGGERASLVWTDPPYGVSYGEKNRYLQSIGRADRLLDDIEGDQASPDEVYSLTKFALEQLATVSQAGAVAYVAAPPGPLHIRFIQAMNDSGFEYRHQLIWLKNQLVFGRSDYMYKHEPILYGWLQNGAHFFEPVTNNCTVFEFDRPRASKMHPTEKPVELVSAMILNSSRPTNIVGDPFCGSGTTLIACEQTNRIGYGMEIEPKYCAVTLERLSGMGLEPRLYENCETVDDG